MAPKILCVVGPTACGKTTLGVLLAKKFNGEVVSVDSMQIYRGMTIGTAAPTEQEMDGVPHHMIAVADPTEQWSAARYAEAAIPIVDDILSRGKLPLLVGGTGLYLQAISYDMALGEKGADSKLRDELNRIAAKPEGPQELHDRLKSVDPATAERLHPNDVRRVIRALEIFETSGKGRSEQENLPRAEGPYHVLVYGLSMPREQMYARINRRVDTMIADGLVQEVQSLLDKGISPRPEGGAMQAIGYKEIVSALQGELTLDQAIALIKQSSRRYAKRQWTWFRHDQRTKWFDWTEYSNEQDLVDALTEWIQSDLL